MKITIEENGFYTLTLDDGTEFQHLEKSEAESMLGRIEQVIAKNRRLDRMLILGWVAIVTGLTAISYWLW